MVDNLKILELMSARMFHDLAGPIGAINNSLEFFESPEGDHAIREKALEIVRSSSDEAILRLKYFRQAYGPINEEDVAISDLSPVIGEFVARSKIHLICKDNKAIISCYMAKILLNFGIIGLHCMIYGGDLEITPGVDQTQIKFTGKNLILNDHTVSLLQGDLSFITLNSSNIQIYYTYLTLSKANLTLSLERNGDNEVIFIVKR